MKTKEFALYQKLTTKDIMILSECSQRTAERIKRLIKDEYSIEIVTFQYYKLYYCIP